VKKYLGNVQLHGNPYGLSAKKRADWMTGAFIGTF
jgi:hypothetical protein